MASNTSLVIPPRFTRNHPSQTAKMQPDEAGEYLLKEMERQTGITIATADILDVGCGSRFAASIVNRGIKVKSYTGIDVYKDMTDYLTESTQVFPRLRFYHWAVRNALYNPEGEALRPETELPVEGKFDIVCFFSVFTHLSPDDTRSMLKIASRHVKNSGRVFLTAFVDPKQDCEFLDQIPDRPLLKAVYRRSYFEDLIREARFAIEDFHPPAPLMAHQYVLRSFAG